MAVERGIPPLSIVSAGAGAAPCFARRHGGVSAGDGLLGRRRSCELPGSVGDCARNDSSSSDGARRRRRRRRAKGLHFFWMAPTLPVQQIAEAYMQAMARRAVAKTAVDVRRSGRVLYDRAVGPLPVTFQAEQRFSSIGQEAMDDANPASQHGETPKGRRQALAAIVLALLWMFPVRLLAEEGKNAEAEKEQSVIGGLLSLFDPNETSKLGKNLPKAYLKSARDVVQTLRASFSEDTGNNAKFRRIADSAKGAIREYISSWRDAKLVGAEQSHQALERALRVLGEFYSKMGPSAVLPEDVRSRVLADLQTADDAL